MLTLVLLLACSEPRDTAPALALTGDVARGEAQYQMVCAGCHGAAGGGVARAPALKPFVSASTDAQIIEVILNGRRGMPAQRVDDQQAADIVAYLRQQHGGAN